MISLARVGNASDSYESTLICYKVNKLSALDNVL